MSAKMLKWFVAALCAMCAACAVITVNVYFPEKDVKQAYKSLDEMLLKQGEENKPSTDMQPGTEAPGGGQPAGEQPGGAQSPGSIDKKEEVKPQSRLWYDGMRLSLISVADAADTIADELAVETSSMPEVLKAYDQMRSRLPQITALFENGAVGLNKQGLLTMRDKTKGAGSEAIVNAENESRKVVITGMAKALQKITEKKQPGVKVNINELMGKAATTFADVRRDEAKPGWWIELANGRWVQK
jgi:uncharacterized protein